MEKAFVGLIAGIFLGALALEILHRKNPELAKKLRKRQKLQLMY